jgi:MFS family permease
VSKHPDPSEDLRQAEGRGRLSALRLDVTPLVSSRDFRFLFSSRSITLLGSQATEVALLFQAKQITGSALAVGLVGVAELLPILFFGLYGGLLADRLDRRRVARFCEAGLFLVTVLLVANAALDSPMLWPLFVGAAAIMALASLQRPSLDAAVPRIVPADQLTAASALLSFASNGGFIVGAAIGGVLATGPGPQFAYALDAASFGISFLLLLGLPKLPQGGTDEEIEEVVGLAGVLAGVKYALSRQDLVGSYAVDLMAMVFAFPNSLFPFVAADLHAEWALGLMFSASAVGALVASATSGWTGSVHRHGIAIALSGAAWGCAIAAFGLTHEIVLALVCLVVAGAADMFSGTFRDTLWNQTIPDEYRGRLAGVEVVSYGLGPSVGQIRAGSVAEVVGSRASLWSGGLICVVGIAVACLALPGFAAYDSRKRGAEGSVAPEPAESQL